MSCQRSTPPRSPRLVPGAALLALAAPALAQPPSVTATPAVYPTGVLTEHGPRRWHTARIVDGITGAPLPQAEVLFVAESPHPLRGELWWQMRAAADADGFVQLDADPQAPGHVPWNWIVVRAPGYGVATSMHHFEDPVIKLQPAVPVPLRLRDALGQPVAGALVGFCGGCGHTPDLVHGRTGADGVVQFAGVDLHNHIADFYVEHPGLHLGYDSVRWLPGEPPADFWVAAGVSTTGVVVDAEGRPVAGAYVGTPDVHRGPWTRTDPDGTFRLHGAKREDDLEVHLGDRQLLFERPPTQPFRLQVPPPDGERVQVVNLPERQEAAAGPADGSERCTLEAVDAEGIRVPDARFRLRGPAPADTEHHDHGENGSAVLFLAPGRYRLWAVAPDHAPAEQMVEVTAGAAPTLTVRLAPAPDRVLVAVPGLPAEAEVVLHGNGSRRDLTDAVRELRSVALPAGPSHLVVHWPQQGLRRVTAIDRATAVAAKRVVAPWFAPTQITGTLRDANGQPTAGRVKLQPLDGELPDYDPAWVASATAVRGEFTLTTEATGTALLLVFAADRDALLGTRTILLPPRSDAARLALGDVANDATRARVFDASGRAPRGRQVGLRRAGWNDVRRRSPCFPLDDGGRWLGPELRAGDVLVVEPPEASAAAAAATDAVVELPVRLPIVGAGPWTFAMPQGGLDLAVRDAAGQPLAATLTLADATLEVPASGHLRLRCLPPGPLRLFVAAANHQSAIVTAAVPERGVATATAVLPPR